MYVDCMSGYRTDGRSTCVSSVRRSTPRRMPQPATTARVRASGAIVSRADLSQPAVLAEVLERTLPRQRLFRGIRHATAWDDDESIRRNHPRAGKGAMLAPEFAEGARILGRMGLTFDAWLYHPQIVELVDVGQGRARHCDGPRPHRRAARDRPSCRARREVLAVWRAVSTRSPTCENVVVKLGGIGMADYGGDWRSQPAPAVVGLELDARGGRSSVHLIETFGADRCMFESNFPVDKASCSYVTLWNTFARIAEGALGRRAPLAVPRHCGAGVPDRLISPLPG